MHQLPRLWTYQKLLQNGIILPQVRSKPSLPKVLNLKTSNETAKSAKAITQPTSEDALTSKKLKINQQPNSTYKLILNLVEFIKNYIPLKQAITTLLASII